MLDNLRSTGEIAKELGVPRDRITYLIEARKIKPEKVVGQYRLFGAAAVDRIKEEIPKRKRRRKIKPQIKTNDFLRAVDAQLADMCQNEADEFIAGLEKLNLDQRVIDTMKEALGEIVIKNRKKRNMKRQRKTYKQN